MKDILKYSDEELIELLNSNGQEQERLWETARNIRNKVIGNKVFIRGIIEFSNICKKNCFYCGIRCDNLKVNRYRLNIDDIMECVDFLYNKNILSVVLQSGEINNNEFKNYLIDIVKKIKSKYPDFIFTISCGEFDFEFYKLLKDAGADRYLLRIETSNKELYSKLHPSTHIYSNREKCLFDLKKLNYQVGTGNMIGLPYQRDIDIINDLKFFIQNDFDMFGLGVYVIHNDTPLATKDNINIWNNNKNIYLNKTLNFIAMLRISMPDVNIATATSLDAISPIGRIQALKAGANVIMPSVTPISRKRDYLLYQNKPNIDDTRDNILNEIEDKVNKANMTLAYNVGNSLHYINRQ